MLTIEPPPCAFISGIANFMPRKTPRALTAISWSQAAVSNRSSTALPLIPASLTRMSSLPKAATAASTAAFHSASLGHVEVVEDRRAVRLGDVGDDRLALVFEHVGDDHLGAFAGEDPRHAGAHAGRAAGDQRDLAVEPHRSSSRTLRAQSTPTAAPRVSPIDRLSTRSAMRSSPVGSRLTMTSAAPLRLANSGKPAAG